MDISIKLAARCVDRQKLVFAEPKRTTFSEPSKYFQFIKKISSEMFFVTFWVAASESQSISNSWHNSFELEIEKLGNSFKMARRQMIFERHYQTTIRINCITADKRILYSLTTTSKVLFQLLVTKMWFSGRAYTNKTNCSWFKLHLWCMRTQVLSIPELAGHRCGCM